MSDTTTKTDDSTAPTTDAAKFASEYTHTPKDNRFVYATSEQILEVFEQGSGIVFLGFPECPWCQRLAPIVTTAAIDEGLDKVYYFNIRTARTENDATYQKIVEHLKPHLQTDDQGNPRVTVPDVTVLKNGAIVGRFEMESSSENENTPDTYWTDARRERAVTQLRGLIQKTR